ncbi:MAG TPA: DUF3352 domain-containing protein [Pyrinomonadaceae bacterium]|nr:DUF3352 domain-containing protein [Pyrinomonadaceae bacterium]
MNFLKLPVSIALTFVLMLAATASAQQKRQTPPKPEKVTPAPVVPTPPPTFDTLLAANTYKIYGEIRSVGQLVKSNSMQEILEPILTLAGPPKEFRNIVKWLNLHAEEVMTSRMLVALEPAATNVPATLFAIEFASADEAAKFQQNLNDFLPKVLPPLPVEKSAAGEPQKPATTEPALPPYHVQQAGSLILITPAKFDIRKLRPAGSKLMAEDTNFRVARNRFNSESIFIYVDIDRIEQEEQQQRIAAIQNAHKEQPETSAAQPRIELATPPTVEEPDEDEPPPPPMPQMSPSVEPPPGAALGPSGRDTKSGEIVGVVKDPPEPPSGTAIALGRLFSSFWDVQAKWPAGLGVAISLDGESFDVRVLMVNAAGEKSDPIPFVPVIASGAPVTPESPNILPADTEMALSMSLDFQQILAALSKPPMTPIIGRQTLSGKDSDFEAPYVALEKQLKIKIKDDLLPLLGSEVAVSLPLSGLGFTPPEPPSGPSSVPSPGPSPVAAAEPKPESKETPKEETTGSPAIFISLRDKEGMRVLLPKIVESLAFKGANSFAQTERRENTELVTYANVLAYAFIGDFLVISPDAATTRHIVDSYLKGETLAGEPHFKNYTRWQPQQLQGQLYISPALMEGYRKWINEPSTKIEEPMRSLMARLSIVPQPVTYSLSNEGFGPLHELHVPKNLVLLMVTALSGSLNQQGK